MMKAVLDMSVLGVAAGMGSGGFPILAVILGVVVVLLVLIFLTGYVKAPPDTAMIISGLRGHQDSLPGEKG